MRTFTLDGRRTGTIRLPGHRQRRRLRGRPVDGSETFYSFTSFNQPDRHLPLRQRHRPDRRAFAEPRARLRSRATYQVRQVFYTSKDGTRVPMFLVHRRDLDLRRPQPTLLYGYGGFNAAELPRYQPRWMTWVDMGGVLAVANIRGGGEYGAGLARCRPPRQQAERLRRFHRRGRASDRARASRAEPQLAIEGRSNGGLLVGAVRQPAAGPVRRGAARPSA